MFSESPVCKSRANCFQCRNNENFRKQMEIQYGAIECPENIPIGAKTDQLPTKSQEAHERMQEMQAKRQQQINETSTILDELQMISSDEGSRLVDRLRALVLPNTKTPGKCKHGGNKIGEVTEACCGGKTTQKPVFECKKHIVTTERKCVGCPEFEGR